MLGVCGWQRKPLSSGRLDLQRLRGLYWYYGLERAIVPWASSLGPRPQAAASAAHRWFMGLGHNVSSHTAADDEQYMREALRLAGEAGRSGEVPVGAVVIASGQIVGRGANATISQNDPTAHAEMLALREAARNLGNYRLLDSTLYVTMEPCAMCAGALVAARVGRLVFGTRDLRFGAVRSKFRIADSDLLNHRVEIVEGVLAAECLQGLQRFFEQRR
jgi:tRNA(adenine34) deaminase